MTAWACATAAATVVTVAPTCKLGFCALMAANGFAPAAVCTSPSGMPASKHGPVPVCNLSRSGALLSTTACKALCSSLHDSNSSGFARDHDSCRALCSSSAAGSTGASAGAGSTTGGEKLNCPWAGHAGVPRRFRAHSCGRGGSATALGQAGGTSGLLGLISSTSPGSSCTTTPTCTACSRAGHAAPKLAKAGERVSLGTVSSSTLGLVATSMAARIATLAAGISTLVGRGRSWGDLALAAGTGEGCRSLGEGCRSMKLRVSLRGVLETWSKKLLALPVGDVLRAGDGLRPGDGFLRFTGACCCRFGELARGFSAP